VRIVPTLSPVKQQKLKQYVAHLDRWRSVTNLISEQSFAEIWDRHIEDVLWLQQNCLEKRLWLDIGSGAGLPGVVLGVVLSDVEGARIHCVESDGRKCAFLRSIVERLALPVKVHQARMEALDRSDFGAIEVVTARAFSSIPGILSLAQPFLASGAMLVLPRGKTGLAEVERIDQTRYSVKTTTNPEPGRGVIIFIKNRDREL